MRGSICGVLALAAICALPVANLVARGQTTDVPKPRQRVNPLFTPRLPSTATFKITRVTPQADGSTPIQEWTEVIAWDSEKRQLTSTATIPQSGDQAPTTQVVVLDRKARTVSRWSVPGEQVTVTDLPDKRSGTSLCAATFALTSIEPRLEVPIGKAPHGMPVTQSLGKVMIDGVEARGSRTTVPFQSDAIGSSESLTRITEVWSATDPGVDLIVRLMVDDPLSGKLTRELQDLDMNEPDPRLYLPPPEYRIVHQDYPKCPASQVQSGKSPSPLPEQ
ncbi:MAG: hypothetical protein ABR956_15830 [Terracidiphilus sp.]|jgi:hypothetical protein